MPYALNGVVLQAGEPFVIDEVQHPGNVLDVWPRADLEALGLVWVEPPEPEPVPRRVTKSRFGDLFTYEEHRVMNLLRWQTRQMDAVERGLESNPLVLVETLFRKFDWPAEFIELDLPMVSDGLALLAMLGVFGDSAEARISAILSDHEPT